METQSHAGRWWENYLVRYFMPSIAGIGIVSWLTGVGPSDLRQTLFFGKPPASLDGATLTLLILYGNLFCYVASYPILCFHATRVIDFEKYSWQKRLVDGYIATSVFSVLVGIASITLFGVHRVIALFILVIVFSILQLTRIYLSMVRISIKRWETPTTLLYGYLVFLAKRRGIVSVKTVTTSTDDEDTETNLEEVARWRMDLVESYRHMREHGNSAFIFLLEILLASICYGILSIPNIKTDDALSLIAITFAVWSVPAAFVHLLGQHIERRYSKFDNRLQS